MSEFQPADPNFAERIAQSFAKQGIMTHIGATMPAIGPGYCEIHLPYGEHVSQQHGFFHGGVVGTIADSAGGYAAFSLMAADVGILTVEYKINLAAPADGDLLIAKGTVIKPGRTLTLARAEVFVRKNGKEKFCAAMQQTLMCIAGRADVTG